MVNAVLAAAFAFERHLVAWTSIPIGLSYAAILRRPSVPTVHRER